ncbi:MAG TPA: Bax inhibitor-1/YccA family protein [Longimicrobiaceae bacterium]|nr:Bax inhibitor-1/YccA family protein [Longimicrobiaceae bacterium]
MRGSSPALNSRTFTRYAGYAGARMTVEGTINKTGFLLLCMVVPATWMWIQVMQGVGSYAGTSPVVGLGLIGGLIGGLVFALVTVFKPTWAPVTAPLYAICEGFVLGAISAQFEAQLRGIVIQAVALTIGVLLTMLVLYRTGVIRVTERFRMMVVAATGAVFLVYLGTFVLGIFGVHMPYIHDGGTLGIVFSLVVIGIAAMNLALDFDFIEQGAADGAPAFLEWYGAFGLMVTLVWLYLRILHLLAQLNRRR